MYDAANFQPCPNRPNHWVQVRHIPEQTVNHGTRTEPRIEVRPAMDVPTGEEICGRPGQSLEELVEELNRDAGNE